MQNIAAFIILVLHPLQYLAYTLVSPSQSHGVLSLYALCYRSGRAGRESPSFGPKAA